MADDNSYFARVMWPGPAGTAHLCSVQHQLGGSTGDCRIRWFNLMVGELVLAVSCELSWVVLPGLLGPPHGEVVLGPMNEHAKRTRS